MVSSASSIAASASASTYNYNRSIQQIALSSARLSSGNRIQRASDDIGAMTSGLKLQTSLTSLRQALQNTTQADSMLQTAYNGLSSIYDVLSQMNSVAVSASSGSLTSSERAYLQQQFSTLSDEIDRVAGSTTFNGISLLDGSLSEENRITTETAAATKGQAVLTFSANIGTGETVVINGTTLTEGTDFTAAGTTSASLSALATAINNSTAGNLRGVVATAGSSTLTLSDRAGGDYGQRFTVNQGTSTASFTTAGGTTASATIFSFANGDNDGLTHGSVVGYGTSGDSLITTQSQTKGEVRFTLASNATNGETLSIDNSNGGTQAFTFRTTAATSTEIQIGSTIEQTLQNAIDTIGSYTGTVRYTLDQLDFIRDGNTLVMRHKLSGNGADLTNTALDFAESSAGGTLSSATMANGTNTGINTNGVTNKDFIGRIQGFSATYTSADNITANITVGDYTYQATISDTTPAAATFARFKSTTTGGGYFDMEIAAGGLAVTNQTDANTFASRLNAAFGGMTFSQNRLADSATSYTAAGDLMGSSFEFQLDDFSTVDVQKIQVNAPVSSSASASVEITVNGETFRTNSNLGQHISEYEVIDFTSTTSTNKLRLRMGDAQVDLTDATEASDFESTLRTAFGIGDGSNAVSFQLGETTSNTLDVAIGSATTEKLFGGATLSVATANGATSAQDTLSTALDSVQLLMAKVGAMQERAQYAQDEITNQITSKDAARAVLLDTDVADESTKLAAYTVQSQGAIAVLAQTQALSGHLLTLMQRNFN
jgi:flagellin